MKRDIWWDFFDSRSGVTANLIIIGSKQGQELGILACLVFFFKCVSYLVLHSSDLDDTEVSHLTDRQEEAIVSMIWVSTRRTSMNNHG